MKNLDLCENAIWKQRFRAQSIEWAEFANLNRQRGLVCTDRDGVTQLYAWNIATGDLRQLTDQPAGVVNGLLSADGEYVYYLRDDGGNEIGHYVRVPFGGGPEEDVTPDLPPYGSFGINQSFQGNMLGTQVADPSGRMLIVFSPGKAPRQIHKSQNLFFGPSLSHSGEIGVIATTEGTNSLDTRLIAFDLESGEQIAELWDGAGAGHNLGDFAPLPGDFRLLSTTSKSGYERPIIWNPYTGERNDMVVDEIPGEVTPLSWSEDAERVLFGGSPEEKPEEHKKSSPITYADQIQAPILVIQGSNDTRCPSRQMLAYEARLSELGKQIEIHWFEAGHGSRAQEQQLEHQERKMRFAYRVLG